MVAVFPFQEPDQRFNLSYQFEKPSHNRNKPCLYLFMKHSANNDWKGVYPPQPFRSTLELYDNIHLSKGLQAGQAILIFVF